MGTAAPLPALQEAHQEFLQPQLHAIPTVVGYYIPAPRIARPPRYGRDCDEATQGSGERLLIVVGHAAPAALDVAAHHRGLAGDDHRRTLDPCLHQDHGETFQRRGIDQHRRRTQCIPLILLRQVTQIQDVLVIGHGQPPSPTSTSLRSPGWRTLCAPKCRNSSSQPLCDSSRPT